MLRGTCHCGGLSWTFDGMPSDATACNCTTCRRTGALWAYDFEGGKIAVEGKSSAYARADKARPVLEFHFCPTCSNVAFWRGLILEPDGRRRIAVNLRLAEPNLVGHIVIDHFDGLVSFDDLPRDGRCVSDMWF